jgi:hypothetical protein
VHLPSTDVRLSEEGKGEDMEQEETCYFCGGSDQKSRLVPWFVQTYRRSVHMACFLAAYGADSDAESLLEQRAA